MERWWVGEWKTGRWRDEGWMDDGCLGGEVERWMNDAWLDGWEEGQVYQWINEWINQRECNLVTQSIKQPEQSFQLHLGSSPPTQKSGTAFILHSTELYKSRFWLQIWIGILYFLLLGISFPHSLKRGSSLVCLVCRCDWDTLNSMSPPRPFRVRTQYRGFLSFILSFHVQDPLSPLSLSVWRLAGHCHSQGPGPSLVSSWDRLPRDHKPSFHRQKTHVS